MNDPGGADPELAELRRRRMKDLIEGRSASAPPPRSHDVRPTDLTASSFPAFLGAHPRVVVDVWAPWCGPCRAVSPVLEGLAKRLYPQIRFAKVNADQEPAWTARWGVSGIPTLLMFERGRLIDRLVGAYSSSVLEGRLRTTFQLNEEPPPRGEG